MDQVTAIRVLQEALLFAIIISAPMLGVSLVVGLAISIFQTTTSIQEQTLSFVPKIIAIMLAVLIFGSWMIQTMMDYTINLWGLLEKMTG